MRIYLCILLLLTHPPKHSDPLKTYDLPEIEIVYSRTIEDHCLDISYRLDKLGYLSVSPELFAKFIYTVALCESGLHVSAKGKDSAGSHGLWQMTTETRLKLKAKKGGLQQQADAYFLFLKAGGKKKIRNIKNSVDLHCYNFAPARSKDGILSKVTNEWLDAIDLTRDSLITREDFVQFQKKKRKND